MDIVDPRFDAYMASRLARFDEPVLLEMEAEGKERGFPIVGRNVGVTLEVLARSIGARRVMELGSGFGYSAYWFARAVGPGGEIHCTDGDQANADSGVAYLARAGVGDRVTYHVGDALGSFAELDGDFDVVFCDIDKPGYPDAWRAASERIRVGGLYICDNTLGYGRGTVLDEDEEGARAIREHNALVAADERFISTIVPTREGDLVAIRIG
ncbi:MAG TPA: O-methyltransferase [Actinomycetota bacterium]|nr:O-methyltransferase [Actinomycetota bacterium]